MKYWSVFSALLILLSLMVVGGCARVVPQEQLDAVCEAEAGFHTKGTVQVDGFYLPGEELLFSDFGVISANLSGWRFHYIERDADVLTFLSRKFKKRYGEKFSSGRYLRFSIAKRGDPRCAYYEERLEELHNLGRAAKVGGYRDTGLYPDACVAVERTDELLSEYGVFTRAEFDSRFRDSAWVINEVRHLATGQVQAEFRTFQHCRKGFSRSGRCSGYPRDVFLCPESVRTDYATRRRIMVRTLLPTDNPFLARELETIRLNEPIRVPIQEVEPELLEVIEGEDNIKKISGDSFYDIYSPFDPEGRAWTGKKKIRYSQEGIYYHSEKPTLNFIRDKERQLFRVDINIGKQYKRSGYMFSSMRAIPGDAIYFLAWGGRMERHEAGKNFYILRYSWQGKLERVVKGSLPFTFLVKGNPLHDYANLEIHPDHYRFSVLESDGRRKGGGVQAFKEYRFKVGFKSL